MPTLVTLHKASKMERHCAGQKRAVLIWVEIPPSGRQASKKQTKRSKPTTMKATRMRPYKKQNEIF